MHEIRVTGPRGHAREVAAAALAGGIERVTVSEVRLHAAEGERDGEMVSAECPTPQARRFLENLFAAEWFDAVTFSVSTRELRGIASATPVREATRPMPEPALDVLQDLWQLSHTTASYLGRAAAGGLLLADGMYRNNPVSIVVAALFLPYLSQVLAVSLGLWAREARLAAQGAKALAASTLVSVACGALMACFEDAPMAFADFRPLLPSLLFSLVVGLTAGLCSADDTGRRYLIGVAAAVQCGVFPVWAGACLVDGFPSAQLAMTRIGTFAGNLALLGVGALISYAVAGLGSCQARALHRKMHR